MVIGPQQPRQPAAARRPDAAFVAQLLAARENITVQRGRRRASTVDAHRAYRAADAITVKRVPIGYRTSAKA